MSGRTWAAATAGWVGVVIAGSAVTWMAISHAGDQVTGAPGAASTQPGVVSTLDSAPTASAPQSSTPSPSTVEPSPTAVATGTGQPASPKPTQAPTGRSTAPSPKPQQEPATVRAETRTWTGAPGFVTVSCTGRQAQLKGASPSDGWSYEVGDAFGDSVEVKFQKGGTEVQVHATCEGGAPRFQVESGGERDGYAEP